MASYRDAQYNSIASVATPTLSITKPTGLQSTDLLLAFIEGTSVATPTGWTALTPNGNFYFFYKVADTTDAAASTFPFSSAATTALGGILLAVSNPDTVTPINVSNSAVSSGNTNTVSGSAVTPSANVLLLQFAAYTNTSSIIWVSNGITNNNPTWNTAVQQNALTGNYSLAAWYARYDHTTTTGNAFITTSSASTDVKGEFVIGVNLAPAIATSALALSASTQKPIVPVMAQVLNISVSILSTAFAAVSTIWTNLSKNSTSWINQSES